MHRVYRSSRLSRDNGVTHAQRLCKKVTNLLGQDDGERVTAIVHRCQVGNDATGAQQPQDPRTAEDPQRLEQRCDRQHDNGNVEPVANEIPPTVPADQHQPNGEVDRERSPDHPVQHPSGISDRAARPHLDEQQRNTRERHRKQRNIGCSNPRVVAFVDNSGVRLDLRHRDSGAGSDNPDRPSIDSRPYGVGGGDTIGERADHVEFRWGFGEALKRGEAPPPGSLFLSRFLHQDPRDWLDLWNETGPWGIKQIIRDAWPDELEARALEIAYRESRYVPTAKNFCCYGIFQIYWNVHKSWLADIGITNDQQLYDPATNARAAYALYQRAGGWGPWAL